MDKILKNKIFWIFCIKVDIHTHKFYLHTQKERKEKDKIIDTKERTNDKIIIID